MLRAYYLRILDLLELGDILAVDEEIEAYSRVAKELRQPLYLWQIPFFRASRALREGRFQECERLAREALAIGQRAQDATASIFFEVLFTVSRMVQGKIEGREEAIKRFIEKYMKIPGERATLANLYSRLGRREDAQREFEQVAANDFSSLPRDGSWLVTMANLSYVCAPTLAMRAAPQYCTTIPSLRWSAAGTGSDCYRVGSILTLSGSPATQCPSGMRRTRL